MFVKSPLTKMTATIALIVVNVLVYVFTSMLGGNFINTDLNVLLFFGQANYLVLEGWYWQLFTSMFVHVNFIHLTMNMLFLFIFGIRAEELFSKKLYLGIYIESGLVGNILTLLMGPAMVSAGASGAIFGIFGASIIYVGQAVGRSIMNALAYAFIMLLLSSMAAGVNILAHLGGLAAGLIIGYAAAKVSKFA